MYGRSPLSVVVVCEPITVQLNTCPLPEHWSWYSVITPFGFIGVSHVRENDKESLEIPDMLRGIVGPVKEK